MRDVVTYKEKQSMIARYRHKTAVAVMAAFGALMATSASAAVDVTPLVSEITGNKSGMETIMLATLGIIAFIFGFNLLRRVLR